MFDHFDEDGLPRDRKGILTTMCGHSLATCHTNRCFLSPPVPAAFHVRFLAPPDFGMDDEHEAPRSYRQRKRQWVNHAR